MPCEQEDGSLEALGLLGREFKKRKSLFGLRDTPADDEKVSRIVCLTTEFAKQVAKELKVPEHILADPILHAIGDCYFPIQRAREGAGIE